MWSTPRRRTAWHGLSKDVPSRMVSVTVVSRAPAAQAMYDAAIPKVWQDSLEHDAGGGAASHHRLADHDAIGAMGAARDTPEGGGTREPWRGHGPARKDWAMYYQVMITPAAGGCGLWQVGDAYGEGYADVQALLAAVLDTVWDVWPLRYGTVLPADVRDIRGDISEEPDRVFAIRRTRDAAPEYFGIVNDCQLKQAACRWLRQPAARAAEESEPQP